MHLKYPSIHGFTKLRLQFTDYSMNLTYKNVCKLTKSEFSIDLRRFEILYLMFSHF